MMPASSSACPICGQPDCNQLIGHSAFKPILPVVIDMPERTYVVQQAVIHETGVVRFAPGETIPLSLAVALELPGAAEQAVAAERAVKPAQDRAVHPAEDR